MEIRAFTDVLIRGFLHTPNGSSTEGLVLTHGAGSNCETPLLVSIANAFAEAGVLVLRCDLPFRQERRTGPPFPAQAGRDRAGLAAAVAKLRELVSGPILLGGHSYGGRQASMLCAEERGMADRLVLFSYPLHPPKKPSQLRTAHFPSLQIPTLFVHGTKDGFGSVEELELAIGAIPARTEVAAIQNAGHDLKKGKFDLGAIVMQSLRPFR